MAKEATFIRSAGRSLRASTANKKDIANSLPLAVTAAVIEDPAEEEEVVIVTVDNDWLEMHELCVQISSLNNKPFNLHALIDTGSPVSIIKNKHYKDYRESNSVKLLPPTKRLKSILNNMLKIVEVSFSELTLSAFGKRRFTVNFFVVEDQAFVGDLLFGRDDFVADEKLSYNLQKV